MEPRPFAGSYVARDSEHPECADKSMKRKINLLELSKGSIKWKNVINGECYRENQEILSPTFSSLFATANLKIFWISANLKIRVSDCQIE